MADNLAPSSSSIPGSPAEDTVNACPSVCVLELAAGKWALCIFPALENGLACDNEPLRHVGNGISQKILTQTLRELEANGLILRTVYDSVPPHVGYCLSPPGKPFNRTFVGLDDWVRAHRSDMERVRKGQAGSD